MQRQGRLDDRPVRDYCPFRNHDDAVADVAILGVLIHAVPGMDHDIATDRGIFVDDRAMDAGILPDLDGAFLDLVVLKHLDLVVKVRPDDDRVRDFAAFFNHRADADDRTSDLGIGDDTAVGKKSLFDRGIVDLARGQ